MDSSGYGSGGLEKGVAWDSSKNKITGSANREPRDSTNIFSKTIKTLTISEENFLNGDSELPSNNLVEA